MALAESTYHSWRRNTLRVVWWCHLCCTSQEKGGPSPCTEGCRSHRRSICGGCTQKDDRRVNVKFSSPL